MQDVTRLRLASSALITIDLQRDTLDGQPLEIPGTSAVLPQVARLCNAFRSAGAPVIHVVRLYRSDGSNAELCRQELVKTGGPVLQPGTTGRLLAGEILGPEASDLDDELLLEGGVQQLGTAEFVVYKPRWGAFYQTALQALLDALAIDSLVFVGCNFPNCPRTSIYEASERDFRVALVADAVSGLYDRGEAELLNIGVAISSTEDVIELLGGLQLARSPLASRENSADDREIRSSAQG